MCCCVCVFYKCSIDHCHDVDSKAVRAISALRPPSSLLLRRMSRRCSDSAISVRLLARWTGTHLSDLRCLRALRYPSKRIPAATMELAALGQRRPPLPRPFPPGHMPCSGPHKAKARPGARHLPVANICPHRAAITKPGCAVRLAATRTGRAGLTVTLSARFTCRPARQTRQVPARKDWPDFVLYGSKKSTKTLVNNK
jgi:hypothetical protein